MATLRTDVSGVTQIQVNGGMDSGSSGGPVIDSRGVVVGIARAGIKGSTVNFAVPAEKIRGLLHGRIDDTNIGDPYFDNATVKVPVSMSFLQANAPKTTVKDVKLEMWMGSPGQQRPAALKPPRADSRRQRQEALRTEPDAPGGPEKTLRSSCPACPPARSTGCRPASLLPTACSSGPRPWRSCRTASR